MQNENRNVSYAPWEASQSVKTPGNPRKPLRVAVSTAAAPQVCLQGGGHILRETLSQDRPYIRVQTGCLVAFTPGLKSAASVTGKKGPVLWVWGVRFGAFWTF